VLYGHHKYRTEKGSVNGHHKYRTEKGSVNIDTKREKKKTLREKENVENHHVAVDDTFHIVCFLPFFSLIFS
jgi:hypothetical protein